MRNLSIQLNQVDQTTELPLNYSYKVYKVVKLKVIPPKAENLKS